MQYVEGYAMMGANTGTRLNVTLMQTFSVLTIPVLLLSVKWKSMLKLKQALEE